jgi:hypothetical protein
MAEFQTKSCAVYFFGERRNCSQCGKDILKYKATIKKGG